MSLAEAVLDIADEMEQVGPNYDYDGMDACRSILSWAKQLRRAVKAAEGSAPLAIIPAGGAPFPGGAGINVQPYPPEVQHMMKIAEARKEFRKDNKAVERAETVAGKLTELVGGNEDKVYLEIGDMEVGRCMYVGSQVYEMRADGKLHYNEAETKRRAGNAG